jgi:hypothetical protein
VAGKHRVMEFYTAARLDGLERREEIIGEKVVESFAERDDNMTWRSATVMSPARVSALSEAAHESLTRGLGTEGVSSGKHAHEHLGWPVGKGLDVHAGRSRGMVAGGSMTGTKDTRRDGKLRAN